MPNYDGEYEVRIFYTTEPSGLPELEHTMTFDVAISNAPTPGTDWGAIETDTPDTSNPLLEEVVDAFVTDLLAFYPAATEFIRAELWFAAEATENFTFISVGTLGAVGTNPTASTAAGQITMTFRSLGGGIMRLQLMEPSGVTNTVDSWPWAGGANTLGQRIISTAQPFRARDNTRPITGNKLSQTQNEALYRKRYRNT